MPTEEDLLTRLFRMRETLLHPLFHAEKTPVDTTGEFLDVFLANEFLGHGLVSLYAHTLPYLQG